MRIRSYITQKNLQFRTLRYLSTSVINIYNKSIDKLLKLICFSSRFVAQEWTVHSALTFLVKRMVLQKCSLVTETVEIRDFGTREKVKSDDMTCVWTTGVKKYNSNPVMVYRGISCGCTSLGYVAKSRKPSP